MKTIRAASSGLGGQQNEPKHRGCSECGQNYGIHRNALWHSEMLIASGKSSGALICAHFTWVTINLHTWAGRISFILSVVDQPEKKSLAKGCFLLRRPVHLLRLWLAHPFSQRLNTNVSGNQLFVMSEGVIVALPGCWRWGEGPVRHHPWIPLDSWVTTEEARPASQSEPETRLHEFHANTPCCRAKPSIDVAWFW